MGTFYKKAHNDLLNRTKVTETVKPVLSGHSKRTPNIGFQQYRSSLNAGQKYCRMLQVKDLECSKLRTTHLSIKLSFSIKTLVLPIFKWSLKTGFTVFWFLQIQQTFAMGDIGWNVYKSRDKKDMIRNSRAKTVDSYRIK